MVINANKLYNYIQETNDMIEHLLYKLDLIKKIIDDNTYIDLETKEKYIDKKGINKIKKIIN